MSDDLNEIVPTPTVHRLLDDAIEYVEPLTGLANDHHARVFSGAIIQMCKAMKIMYDDMLEDGTDASYNLGVLAGRKQGYAKGLDDARRVVNEELGQCP